MGDTLGKQWGVTGKLIYFISGLTLLMFSGVFYLIALKYGKLGVVSVAWDAFTSVVLITIGWLIFKESLSTPQLIAVGLIFFALFLLFRY